jgi:hypothetical protein
LLTISYNNNDDAGAVDGMIGGVGAIQVIVNALQTYPNDQEVKSSGCGALLNLTNGSKKNLDALVKLEGIPLVIERFETFPMNATLLGFGCSFINNICSYREYRPILMKAGAVHVIEEAMKNHAGDAGIQKGI